MLDNKQLGTLMFKAASVNTGETLKFSDKEYTEAELNFALRTELNEVNFLGSAADPVRKALVFRLIQETVDKVLPKRVFDALDRFAEIRTVKNGEKVTFTQRVGQERARNFVTQVGHAGLYEVFKLDRRVFDIGTNAYGAAVMISFEEYLEGRIDFSELIQCVTEGYEVVIYKEILRQMVALNSQTLLPANNIRKEAGWDPRGFASLLGIASVYDKPTIFCSYIFAAEILPEGHLMTDAQKEQYSNQGYLGNYKGADIVVLPHSFYDTSNEAEAVTLPLGLAWILPAGKEKPVKIVFEGETNTKEIDNDDWSKEIHFYKKIGTALFANPGICVYENTALNDWPVVKGPIIKIAKGEVTPTFTRIV